MAPLVPWKSGCDSKNVIFNLVFLFGIFRSSHDNALRWMPQDLTDDKSTLVQVMACCRQATSHYLSQCWLSSLSPYGVARPQWVNSLAPGRCGCWLNYFQTHIKDRYLELFLWNCPQTNDTTPHLWLVNIGSGNGLVPSGNKPLPEPMLTQIYAGIWNH